MTATMTPAQERCWEQSKSVNREARSDPGSPYSGKWVGFVDGELAVVVDTVDEMLTRLKAVEPDSTRCLGIEASRDYTVVDFIWAR
ncbi:MAG: hypothetical protein COY42_28630 [Armatimonadetes bacterium CG_4_10_14_0_8_um_filter_66_14]|nr:MAG: hypothetical protein COZ05_16055 [Armatimonadetes bacterium CG_4_10_14_3_um_filter_59_10]PIZ34452.1 MAG: hypothetical protein COY42_28630 [Armatimonadetes bacterium CG_4_10_14_0_8_um_filter_66_14]PJB65173.1 MAG: hypothetical protein CO096_18915 [Armatimonadetes bacterium CG_4_9_14_3_um_filter_66_14]